MLETSRPRIAASTAGAEDGSRFTQTPHLEFTDESGTAVRSIQNRIIRDDVEKVVNAWHTYGPIAGPPKLFEFTAEFRMWFEASIGVPSESYAGQPLEASSAATMFRNVVTFKQDNTISSMMLLQAGGSPPQVANISVVIAANATATPVTLQPTAADFKSTLVAVAAGGWWALWSPQPSQTQLFTWRGDPVVLRIAQCIPPASCTSNWFEIQAPSPLTVRTGDNLTIEFAQIGLSLLAKPTTSTDDVLELQRYVAATPELSVTHGVQQTDAAHAGLLEVELDSSGVAALSVPQASDKNTILPMRFRAMCHRWTVGLLQRDGYTIGWYGGGSDRWT